MVFPPEVVLETEIVGFDRGERVTSHSIYGECFLLVARGGEAAGAYPLASAELCVSL